MRWKIVTKAREGNKMDLLIPAFLESVLLISALMVTWSMMTKDDELNGMRKTALVVLIAGIIYYYNTSSIKLLTLIN